MRPPCPRCGGETEATGGINGLSTALRREPYRLCPDCGLDESPSHLALPAEDVTSLARIRTARDHCAEHGHYPEAPNGPGVDQGFDDWAADIVSQTLDAMRDAEDIS